MSEARPYDLLETEEELDEVFGKPGQASAPIPDTSGEPIGALAQWRRELAKRFRGRTVNTCDALSRAAAYEAQGLELRAAKLPIAASRCFEKASEIILEAAADRAKARGGAA